MEKNDIFESIEDFTKKIPNSRNSMIAYLAVAHQVYEAFSNLLGLEELEDDEDVQKQVGESKKEITDAIGDYLKKF